MNPSPPLLPTSCFLRSVTQMVERPREALAHIGITTSSCLAALVFLPFLATQYNSIWSICRLVAGPPATLCPDSTKITVDEGATAIELCPQGEEVYTAAEALHPGQDITYVNLHEHSTALKLCVGISVATFAVYLFDSMSTQPSCNVCYTPGSQHVNRCLVCCTFC